MRGENNASSKQKSQVREIVAAKSGVAEASGKIGL